MCDLMLFSMCGGRYFINIVLYINIENFDAFCFAQTLHMYAIPYTDTY